MITLGIDPGATGAIAAIDDDGTFIDCVDMVSIGGVINAPILAHVVLHIGNGPRTAWVEQAQAMPKQGVTSSFNYGVGYGIILGVLGALDIPYQTVRPSVWKKKAGLTGKDKDASRRRATELYPAHAHLFARAKDHGRAEACLIARHGWLADRGEAT